MATPRETRISRIDEINEHQRAVFDRTNIQIYKKQSITIAAPFLLLPLSSHLQLGLLNSSKSEFLLTGLSKQLAKIHNSSLDTTHSARNFIFDEHLTFSDQTSSSPNLAITIFVSFAVSVHTSIPKQLPPSPLPLFSPSVTTATVLITTCPSRQVSDHPVPTLLYVLLSKFPNPVTSLSSFGLCSLHWLQITDSIEYKLLSLTYKVLKTTQLSYLYLHNHITVQGPDLQNILRFIVILSEFIVRSTYYSDLRRAKISLRNIV